MTRAARVLITPREIAGVAAGLQDVLGRRGHRVDVLLRWRHAFGYSYRPAHSRLLRLLAGLVAEDDAVSGAPARRVLSLGTRLLLLPFIAARYDTVVYIGQDTLVRGSWDRRLLRRLGVRTVTVFCGSEARPPYLDGWYAGAGAAATLDETRAAVTRNRERVQQAERDSAYVVNHPGGAQFHLQPFLNWTVLGFPQRAATGSTAPESTLTGGPPRVLHAPSDLRMKGTVRIRSAIAQLESAGTAVEYVEVSGRSHSDVQHLLRSADLVVDQLYSDALLPGLATEAAHAGTAVVVCGYAGELVADAAARTGAPTSHYCSPDALPGRLAELLTDPASRDDLARELHAFVTTGHWSTEAIGARWERIVSGAPDPAWFDVPSAIVYPHGCALPRDALADFLRRYVARFGVDGLELGHHPALVDALLELARS